MLADVNADGKMDRREFVIAMVLIKRKLQGYELPTTLPLSLLHTSDSATSPPLPAAAAAVSYPGQPVTGMMMMPPSGQHSCLNLLNLIPNWAMTLFLVPGQISGQSSRVWLKARCWELVHEKGLPLSYGAPRVFFLFLCKMVLFR